MGNKFASGRNSIAECDRCGQRFKLTELRKEIQKQRLYDLMVCNVCWDPDQPQLMLGTFPVDDPQGVRNPRPDLSYQVSGLLADGYQGGGSRVFQWGWNPVGGSQANDAGLTPNALAMAVEIGTVTISVT
jgi:hypothetical protein